MRVPIPFDKEVIDVSETLENIDWYLSRCSEAYKYLEADKRTTMAILREINKNLEEEYRYYHLSRVCRVVRGTKNEHLFQEYKHAITKALVKQTNRNAYSALSSNLYDVQDYLRGFKYRQEDKLNQ